MELFHATDKKHAENICKSGFSIFPNEEHWLGNGVYFFTDIALAKWWSTNPSLRYGAPIYEPVVLRCSIDEEKLNVTNLLKLDDYSCIITEFQKYFWPLYVEHNPVKIPKINQFRCAFFDYYKSISSIDVVIGNFYKEKPKYIPKISNERFNDLGLKYTEIQVCVYDRSFITIEEVIEL